MLWVAGGNPQPPALSDNPEIGWVVVPLYVYKGFDPLRLSWLGSVILDHSDHGRSNKAMNPNPEGANLKAVQLQAIILHTQP